MWTTEPPTEPGFYWWRVRSDTRMIPVHSIEPTPAIDYGEWWPEKIEPPEDSK